MANIVLRQIAHGTLANGTQINVAFTNPTLSGSLLVAAVAATTNNNAALTLFDSISGGANVWNNLYLGVSGTGGIFFTAYSINSAAGADTVSGLTSGAAVPLTLICAEYTAPNNAPFTQFANAQGNDSRALTTTLLQSLLVALCLDSRDSVTNWAASSGFTIRDFVTNPTAPGPASFAWADQTGPVATYEATFSGTGLNPATQPTVTGIASFEFSVGVQGTFEISLFGTKRFGKLPEPECVESPEPKHVKLLLG